MIKRLAFSALCLLALTSLFLLGCESASNPIAPTGSTLSLSASPTVIALSGESSTLTLIGFRPDGNPLNPGTQLTLSTTFGVIRATNNPSAQVINVVEVVAGGRAEAFLFGDGRQGVATVTAAITTGAEAATATVDVQIGNDATSTPNVTVTANPTAISLNGSSTITITARSADNSVLAGASVQVRTTLGSLNPAGPLTTNSNGVATTTLTSSQSGQAEVFASVGSSEEASATVEIGTTRKPTLELSANPRIIDVLQTSTVSLTIRDESGNLLTSSQQVFLDGDLGTLSTSVGGTQSSSLTVTVSGGRGTVFFTAGAVPGQGGVSGFTGNSDTTTEVIDIRDAPAAITLSANPSTISRGSNSSMVTLSALVTDSQGNRITNEIVTFDAQGSNGADISFECSENPCTDATGNDGIAMVTLTFNGATIPANVDSIVATASVRGGAVQDTVTISVQ